MPTNPSIDPALLAQLQQGQMPAGWNSTQFGNQSMNGMSGDGSQMWTPNAGQTAGYTYKDPSREWYTAYDPSGQFLNAGNGRNSMTAKDVAMFAAAVYGAGTLGNMFGGPGWSFGGPGAGASVGSTAAGGGGTAVAGGGGTAAAGGGTAAVVGGGAGAGTQLPGWMMTAAKTFGPTVLSGLFANSQMPSGGVGGGGSGGAQDAISQQFNQNMLAAQVNNQMNRVNTTTPYGSQTFRTVADPNAPGGYRYEQDIQLSPAQQGLLNQYTGNQQRAGGLASQFLNQAGGAYSSPFSFGQSTQQLGALPGRLTAPDGGVFFEQNRQTVGQGPQFSSYGAGPQYGSVGGPAGPQSYDRVNYQQGGMQMAPAGAPAMSEINAPGSYSPFSFNGPQVGKLPGTGDYAAQRQGVTDSVYNQYQRLAGPQQQRQTDALDNKLKNMGLTEGTAAYQQGMTDLRTSQDQSNADIMDRAVLAGGQEQSRLAGLDLATDAQRFGQSQQVDFANPLTAYQTNRAGAQQDFTNNVTAGNFNNNARLGGYGALLNSLQLNNGARSQDFSNQLGATTANNNFGRASSNDWYSQNLGATGFNNQWAQQGMTDTRGGVDQGNRNAQQGWQNTLSGAGFNNQAYGEEYGRYLSALGLQNNMDLGRAGFNNQAQQQGYNQAMQQYLLPMQMYQGFQQGSGPTMPQFQPFGMANVSPVNNLGYQQQGYQQGMDRYNANMGMFQQGLNALAGSDWWQGLGQGGGGNALQTMPWEWTNLTSGIGASFNPFGF